MPSLNLYRVQDVNRAIPPTPKKKIFPLPHFLLLYMNGRRELERQREKKCQKFRREKNLCSFVDNEFASSPISFYLNCFVDLLLSFPTDQSISDIVETFSDHVSISNRKKYDLIFDSKHSEHDRQ